MMSHVRPESWVTVMTKIPVISDDCIVVDLFLIHLLCIGDLAKRIYAEHRGKER